MRRSHLWREFAAAATLSLLLAIPGGISHGQVLPGEIGIELQLVAEGLTSPVTGTHAGDGSGRLFIVDQAGQIRIIHDDALLPEPFLDLTGLIVAVNSFFDERGLLGLAFHPNYEDNGRFFVRYSVPREGAPDEPCNDPGGFIVGCHSEVLAEFTVSSDPNVANPDGKILFQADEPQFNHNSGHVAFGADGLLYFTLGDGGGAHDGLADDPPSHGPIGNGQNVLTPLGAILRIDVDRGLPYAVPNDNPFVGRPGADEIYAYGLRNPYRFSFDDEGSDDADDAALYLADVGQNLFEEVNIVERGGNYGWVLREGFHCFDPLNPDIPPDDCPATGLSGEPLLDPIAAYTHEEGIAVVGGFVYRGDSYPELAGKYIFGDFSRAFFAPLGRIFYIDVDGPDLSQILEFQLDEPIDLFLFGFAQDENRELYALMSENLGPTGQGGKVYRLAGVEGDDEGDDEDEDDDVVTFDRKVDDLADQTPRRRREFSAR